SPSIRAAAEPATDFSRRRPVRVPKRTRQHASRHRSRLCASRFVPQMADHPQLVRRRRLLLHVGGQGGRTADRRQQQAVHQLWLRGVAVRTRQSHWARHRHRSRNPMNARVRAWFGTVALALSLAPAAAVAQEQQKQPPVDKSAEYRLHAGDSITISVWKELDLQRKVMIRPDGRFSFPLTGEVQAAGRTPDEVRIEIENSLKKFIPEAVVTVIVEEFNGNRVYVIGQVTKPGMYVMNPSLNVLQALSLAGGSTPFAKL